MVRTQFFFLMQIACFVLIIGCDSELGKNNEFPKHIPSRQLYRESPISPIVEGLRPSIQQFKILGDKDTLLIGDEGTIIAISNNTFIDSSGKSVMGEIDIILVEINTFSEMVSANLQTTSGGSILQTAGMFFVDAKHQGKPLAIKNGRSISVEYKSEFSYPRMKIFSGKFNKSNNIEWKKCGELENRLISIPLELLDFNHGAWESQYNETQIEKLTNRRLENTYISTREFETRARVFNYYATTPQMNDLDDMIIDIYTQNINQNLSYSDSLVAELIFDRYSNIIDTAKAFDFDDTGWISFMYKSALHFSEENLTSPINFDDLGVSESSTIENLKHKGFSEEDASKILNLYRIRNQVIQTIRDQKLTERLSSYSFSINQLGWTNVDRFFKDPKAVETIFFVELSPKDTFNYISLSLVIPKYNIVLSTTENINGRYSFTKNQDGYRKLPVGEAAVLIALSVKENKPYFGKKKFRIPQDGIVKMDVGPTNKSSIEIALANLTD